MNKYIIALSMLIVSQTSHLFSSEYEIKAWKLFDEYNDLNGNFTVELPVYDYPSFSLEEGFYPSMQQSLNITQSLSQLFRYGALALIDHLNIDPDRIMANRISLKNNIAYFTIITSEILLFYLPFGYGWLHEEWHRSVMKTRGVDSYNGIYDMRFFSSFVSVNQIEDEDLIRLKSDYPADMVRLSEAGIEAQLELSKELMKDAFFDRNDFFIDYWAVTLNNLNNALYILICNLPDSDINTDEMIQHEGKNMEIRDFVGLDFTAWVYDLFRPYEPYTNRGVHPSGIGIDRYVKYSDLTDDEKRYLKLQAFLTWINFLSPQILTFKNQFEFINPLNNNVAYWNFSLMHYLTSFGFTVDLNLFFQQNNVNLFFSYHNYFNYKNYFPGFDIELLDYPLKLGNYQFNLTTEISLWLQPENQEFTTSKSQPGIFGSIKLEFPIPDHFGIIIEADGKTAGWKAGNVYLDSVFEIRTGIEVIL